MDFLFYAVIAYFTWKMWKAMKEIREAEANGMGEELSESPPGTVSVHFDQPTPEDVIIMNDERGNFLSQGWNAQELFDRFKERFPDLTPIIVDDNAKLFYEGMMLMESEAQDMADGKTVLKSKYRKALEEVKKKK